MKFRRILDGPASAAFAAMEAQTGCVNSREWMGHPAGSCMVTKSVVDRTGEANPGQWQAVTSIEVNDDRWNKSSTEGLYPGFDFNAIDFGDEILEPAQ